MKSSTHRPEARPAAGAASALRSAGILAALVALAGCGGERYVERSSEVVDVPDDYGEVDVGGMEVERWCSDFGQPGLERAVQRAWADNLELRAAWDRLAQARAAASESKGPLWPSARANAQVTRSKRFLGGELEEVGGSGTTVVNDWRASVAASYEINVGGRDWHRAMAADLEAKAARAAARSTAISLTSRVAEAWLDVAAQRERIALLEQQVGVAEDVLEVTEGRFRRGMSTGLDVSQQEVNLERLRGELASARSQLQTSEHRLAALLGEAPSDDPPVETAATLPELPGLPDPGVPADLLERRPDVRAAFLRLKAADQRTAAAFAEQLPTVRLSTDLFLRSDSIAELFKRFFWNIAASISQSLFEGGARRAAVRRAEAEARELLHDYGQTLLTGLREVRDALVREHRQRERVDSLRRQLEAAREALEVARNRYRRGATDFVRVLTSLQSIQDTEQALLEARRQQLAHRIALCRALGGSWVEELDAPEPNAEDASTTSSPAEDPAEPAPSAEDEG